MRKYKEYAIYKDDNLLFIGNVFECAKHFNVKPASIYFLANPAYLKRCKGNRKSGKPKNRKIAIAIEE